MTNLETISFYEKLHDIFERVHPKDMPGKLAKLIIYMEEAGQHHSVDVGDVTTILYDMADAFTFALQRSERSMILADKSRDYEVNIYPIMNFLRDNSTILGELDNLKSRIITLSHEKNIVEMKTTYTFVDSLSLVFGN